MNEALAAAAIAGITSGATTSVGKRCQQWVREVSQSVYGSAYDGFWGSSAKTTAQAFVKHGAQFVASKPYQPGDILYKTTASTAMSASTSGMVWSPRTARPARAASSARRGSVPSRSMER